VKGASLVKHIAEPWSAIVERFTKPPVIATTRTEKGMNPECRWQLFVPFAMKTWEEGAVSQPYNPTAYSRSGKNVRFADLLVLDIDNDPESGRPFLSIAEAREKFAGLAHVIYGSYNHRNAKKHGGVDKFRVVLPLVEPVTFEQFKERGQALAELFPFADKCTKAISQPYYVPMAHPDRVDLHEAYSAEGEWFDFLELEVPRPVEAPAPSSDFVLTDDVHAEANTTFITLKNGGSHSAAALYATLTEGYEGRKSCYRLDGNDQKAGCFVMKKGSGLVVYDNKGASTFIKVLRYKRVDGTADDGPPALTLVKGKGKQKEPNEIVRPDGWVDEDAPTPLIEDEPAGLLVHRVDQRHLDPTDILYNVPERGLIFIRSPKDTGKTTLLEHLVQRCKDNSETALLIGHRQFLLGNLAKRLSMDNYLESEDAEATPYMALCMNSIPKFMNRELDEPYDTVIIDESEQVLLHFLSENIIKDLNEVFLTFCWLIKSAKRVILLDADLSPDLSVELMKELRGEQSDDTVLAVINEHLVGNGKQVQMFESRWALLLDFLEALERGEKIFMTCNSKRFAGVLNAMALAVGKRSLLVTRDTNTLPTVKDFVLDPVGEGQKYDVICTSPTLSTGVSIDEDAWEAKAGKKVERRFTSVYGFFIHQVGTYQDVDQAISRVRQCHNVRVWVQGNSDDVLPEDVDERDIYYDAMRKEKSSLTTLGTSERLGQGHLQWGRFWSRLSFCEKLWSKHKDRHFRQEKHNLGFEVVWHPAPDEETTKPVIEAYNEYLTQSDVDKAPLIFDAQKLDFDEANELERKRVRTADEQLALERFRYSELLKDNWSVESLRRALDQNLLYSLYKVRMLYLQSHEERLEKDLRDREFNTHTFTQNRHRVMQRQLIDSACAKAGLSLDKLLTAAQQGEEIEIAKETLESFALAYQERKRDFGYYFSARIKDPTHETNLKKVWEATMGEHLSLFLKRKQMRVNGERERRYYLDVAKRDLVHKAVSEAITSDELVLLTKKQSEARKASVMDDGEV
jgi:hypothetical protein